MAKALDDLSICLEKFSKKFKSFMKRCNDNREFNLIHIDDRGKFQSLRSGFRKYNFSILYDLSDIEVYYNPDWIQEKYLQKCEKNKEKIENIFNLLAAHEYGHSCYSNTSIEIRNYINQHKNIADSLKSFNLFGIEKAYGDFYADYIAKKLHPNIPHYYLENYFNHLQETDLRYVSYMMLVTSRNYNHTIKDRIYLYDYLTNTMTFYVFNRWDMLENPFKNYDLNSLLEFFNLIFINFERISKDHAKDNLNLTIDKLYELIKFLDNYDYTNLIYNNALNEEIKKGLINFCY